MYAIIYWVGDNYVYPLLNENKTLRLLETLKEADSIAFELEKNEKLDSDKKVEARVISIEGVKE